MAIAAYKRKLLLIGHLLTVSKVESMTIKEGNMTAGRLVSETEAKRFDPQVGGIKTERQQPSKRVRVKYSP